MDDVGAVFILREEMEMVRGEGREEEEELKPEHCRMDGGSCGTGCTEVCVCV